MFRPSFFWSYGMFNIDFLKIVRRGRLIETVKGLNLTKKILKMLVQEYKNGQGDPTFNGIQVCMVYKWYYQSISIQNKYII